MLTKVLALVLVVLIGLALGIETARYVHAHATGVDVSGAVNIHHALGFGLLATSGALLLSLSREWFSRQWTRFTVWLEVTLDGLFDFNSLDVGDGLGSTSGSTSSALSEFVRLMKLYDLRFGAGSAGELRREMDALHRHTDGSLNWQASNAAIIASMERRLAEVPSPGTPDYEACAQDALLMRPGWDVARPLPEVTHGPRKGLLQIIDLKNKKAPQQVEAVMVSESPSANEEEQARAYLAIQRGAQA